MPHRRYAVVLLGLLSACATRPTPVAVIPPPPPVVAQVAPPALPAGASPGMAVPAMLADGTFPTPNARLTPAATVWHLRAGLNVAVLACRTDEATMVARYNALLAANRNALTAAEASYAAEFRSGGGDWRDRYDDSMTRLYNYWSTAPARTAFCDAAAQALADAQTLPADGLNAFAAERLPVLDRAFTDFYRAYDAWRSARLPAPMPPMVIASVAPVATPPALSTLPALSTPVATPPVLVVDRLALADERLASR